MSKEDGVDGRVLRDRLPVRISVVFRCYGPENVTYPSHISESKSVSSSRKAHSLLSREAKLQWSDGK